MWKMKEANRWWILLVSLVLTGCGGSEAVRERMPVSGQVTWNGEPVDSGQIRLIPAEGVDASINSGKILDGEYNLDTRGGVDVGTYRVEITAQRVTREAAREEDTVTEQYLPAQFNRQSALKLIVPRGQDLVTQDFDLSSQ